MSVPANEHLREAVLQSLRMVIDPELGESLVDLGLIYSVAADDHGAVRIEMSTTTKGCPATSYLQDAVHSAAWIVPGVESVDVRLTYDPRWSPDMIDEAIRHKFGAGATGRR